ncbi:MAG: hypothetical protein PHX21_05750 [bacterium]|nr:hypothetical protein [bacterium]
MAIIISKNGKDAKKIDESSFDKEDYLQEYIHNNPETLPLYEIEEDIRLLIVAREFPTDTGPIDALGIDKEGEIYLIETKLYKNPDKRLVVAQVLDYGASLCYNVKDFDDFIRVIDNHINKKFSINLNQKLKDFFNINDEETGELIKNIKSNLNDGNFKFVVLMDKLSGRLKDLINFMNRKANFSIFAVEMQYYKYESYEIMIPKLYGAEVKKEIASGTGNRLKWDKESFFKDAKNKLDTTQLEAVNKLYNFSKGQATEISWGTGINRGSFNPKFSNISKCSLYTVYSDGTLAINFGWHAKELQDKYATELSKLKGIEIPKDYADKWPGISIEKWQPVVDEFIRIIKDITRV